MQSGITASAELQAAFSRFTSDPSLFALPVTISSESLQPLDPLPFKSDFKSSLSTLTPHVQPKTPIYLFVRSSSTQSAPLTAVTYVPSIAPVRSKTLFASTRSSLVRDLGLEKFSDTLFATDAEEILDPAQWDERAAASERSKNGVDTTLLSTEERELQSVRRAEEEERHGTSGRDLMGSGGSGTTWAGKREGAGAASSGVRMKITDDAKEALVELREAASGFMVQFGIELATETLTLLFSGRDVAVGDVHRKIPADKPSYTFYKYPSTETLVFIYTCPGTSKVKERMTYAASKSGVIEIAKGEGVIVTKRLEAGGPDDMTEERLKDVVGVKDAAESDSLGASARQGFARPKRPGKR